MEWTRSPLMRTIALAASIGLVVVHRDERGVWFWTGLALVVLNLVGLLTSRSPAGITGKRVAGSPSPVELSSARPGEDGQSHRLAELLSLPAVASAFDSGPRLWRQVSYLYDTRFEPATAEELAAFVWIENHEGWAIALGDEVKPYVDLDIDEADDPLIRVLEAHPSVESAVHEDREIYRIEQRRPISTEEFAELAARALVSHHVHAAARPQDRD